MRKKFQEIAKKRIDKLFELAAAEIDKNPDRSRRYGKLIWKIATRYNIKLGKKRRLICRKCFTLQIPGKTTKVRLKRNKRVVYECLYCGEKRSYGYRTSS